MNKVDKLIPNLWNKKKYVVHYENLNLYLSLGLKLTKIHRGVKFNESLWLEKYIALNTKEATNEYKKDFFKLMNNSVFGKMMENIRNRVDVTLVNDRDRGKKLAAKPNFEYCTVFDENLLGIHMKKTELVMNKLLVINKPVYLGMCILDLSKILMYDFQYNEAGGESNDEFVGLRAKLYSYKMLEGKESKKCKGVKKSVMNKNILQVTIKMFVY